MSFQSINEDDGSYQLSSSITKKGIEKLLKINNLSFIQFGDQVTDNSIWKNIETILLPKYPNLELRVYGHYGKVCDLSFLQYIPSLKKFSADCLRDCTNVDNISTLKNLEELGVGIFNLTSFDFLNDISVNLKSLFIGQTKSKKPDISMISRFKNLKDLFIDGHNKGIQAISDLKNLEKIVLKSISTDNLDYLKGLDMLWSVDIKLGGIKDLSSLSYLPNIKYLELWQVRKLDNIDIISKLNNLQYLFLQSLPNIEKIPNLTSNKKLRKIHLENLKGLNDYSNLENVENLKEFKYVDCSNLQPEDLIPVLKNKNVKNVTAGFGSDKKNNRFNELKADYGIKPYKWKEFEFI